ncbi:MAG TPA: hypothetical protein VNL37_01180 [Candidatus Polarisedimenticolia bacterium]|nr:hypothetical protein [Candidatus Polarisedimenticolia bacterium]
MALIGEEPDLTLDEMRERLHAQVDTSKNRWEFGVIADCVLLGDRGIGDGGAAGISTATSGWHGFRRPGIRCDVTP